MRSRNLLVLSGAAVLCGAVVWSVVRYRATTPDRGAAAPKPSSSDAAGEIAAAFALKHEREVGGMDRASYDALVRKTWRLLKRGDAGGLVRDLAYGKCIDDIRDDDLRSLVSAKLEESADEYVRAKQSEATNREEAIQKKIDAGTYTPYRERWMEDWDKATATMGWSVLPNGTKVTVKILDGEAPALEQSWRDIRSIEERRVKELTRIFEDHGLVIDWPSK